MLRINKRKCAVYLFHTGGAREPWTRAHDEGSCSAKKGCTWRAHGKRIANNDVEAMMNEDPSNWQSTQSWALALALRR